MHRNTYINSPRLLEATLRFKVSPNLFFGGQITGCEGYMESAATGILAGINAGRMVKGKPLLALPDTTLLGALAAYISSAPGENFQPMNANFGLLPPLGKKIKNKKVRYQAYSQRSLTELKRFLEQWGL